MQDYFQFIFRKSSIGIATKIVVNKIIYKVLSLKLFVI
jgi:hypothetical protein